MIVFNLQTSLLIKKRLIVSIGYNQPFFIIFTQKIPMKKLDILIILVFCFVVNVAFAQRYLEPVFDEVTIETDLVYGENIDIMTAFDPNIQMPTLQDLKMDVYYPTDDTEIDRPLIINVHHGDFIPMMTNSLPVGEKTDSFQVHTAIRLAKMGYVVANIDYRLGWNPFAPSIEERKSGHYNALYRAIQDVKTCARFFRKEVAENDNSFGICPDRIGVLGNGTGGYIALAAGMVETYEEFMIDETPQPPNLPFVEEAINGNVEATTDGFGTFNDENIQLCKANHIEYSSDLSVIINLGGAVETTEWVSVDDPPIISFHVKDDPFTPYSDNFFVGFFNCDIMFEVSGSHTIHTKAATLNLNQIFEDASIIDVFSANANMSNDGLEGLYPFHRPCPNSPFEPMGPACEHAPWEWWNADYWSGIAHPVCPSSIPLEECNFHLYNSVHNQDMSPEKGKTYIDTIVGYMVPRTFLAFNLGSENCSVDTEDLLFETKVNLEISPNPAHFAMRFASDEKNPMKRIEIYNTSGQLMQQNKAGNSHFILDRENLSSGLYIAKIYFEKGILTERIVLSR